MCSKSYVKGISAGKNLSVIESYITDRVFCLVQDKINKN